MNKRLTGLAAVMLSFVLWVNFYLPGAASSAHVANHTAASGGQIRDATVLIKMLLRVTERAGKEAEVVGEGIGTAVAIDGENYLVTHNHWDAVLQDWTKIEIHDSENRLLKLMLGYEFTSLVRYQDEGTLILQIPEDLERRLVPGVAGDPGDVQPGEIVQIAYRQAPSRETAGVLTAVVEEVTNRHGVPVYQLRSLCSGSIQRGDSGGGVWQDGKFAGNLWFTIVSVTAGGDRTASEPEPTDTSYAAVYPAKWSSQQVSETAPVDPPVQPTEDETASTTGME